MGRDNMSQEQMNEALDQALTEEELAQLHEQMEAKPDTAEKWEQLHKTDELLRTTPMVSPSAAFAKRVMEAISALPLPGLTRRELNAGLAVGLAVAAVLAIPVLAVLFFLVLGLVTDPGTFNSLLQVSMDVLTYGVSLTADIAEQIRLWVVETPAAAVLMVLIVPLAAVWGWVLWSLFSGRGLATRRSRS